MILVGVGGSVPRIYEYDNHSRLGDIVVSAPADYYQPADRSHLHHQIGNGNGHNHENGGKGGPWYVYCDQVSELKPFMENGQEVAAAPVMFKHQNFAPKDPILLEVAKQLADAFQKAPKKACVWQTFIDEGLVAMSNTEFDFHRPAAETDKLKLQVC